MLLLDKKAESRSSFSRYWLSTSNSFILFFLVYFTVIHVQWIFIHAALVSSRAFIIPSHDKKIFVFWTSSWPTLFQYSLNTDWLFSTFNYAFNYTGAEKWRETSSEDEYICFFIMRGNYKRTRGHSVYKY